MRHLLAALILILLLASPTLAADYFARVVGISDGDTLTVLKADKTQVKIRLAGVDAPETGQDFGSRAKQAASELAFDKDVTISTTATDRYGRTVAEVILSDGRSLGLELVRKGMAWWNPNSILRNQDVTYSGLGIEENVKPAGLNLAFFHSHVFARSKIF